MNGAGRMRPENGLELHTWISCEFGHGAIGPGASAHCDHAPDQQLRGLLRGIQVTRAMIEVKNALK